MAKEKKGVNKPAPKQTERKSLVQCRIEACQTIDELVSVHKEDEKPLSVNAAMLQLAESEGVPYNTLKHWYYKDDESKVVCKLTQPQTVKNSQKVRLKVAKKIIDNMTKAHDEERAEAQRENFKATAKSQAEELGTLNLADELYELFRETIAKVDNIVKSNNELEYPVDTGKFINDLLRVARNAGWEEPKPEWKKYCSNRTCENFVSKSDRKKARAAIKQKAKGNK